MTTAQLKEYHEELNLPTATRLAIMEAHSIGLEKALAELTERANRGHRAYLCYQGIPEADAEREANRVFPVLANAGYEPHEGYPSAPKN